MERSDRAVLGAATIVVAVMIGFLLLVFVPATWSADDESATAAPVGGKAKGKAAPLPLDGGDPPTKAEGEAAKAKAEAEKKAAELQKQVEDLQTKLQEAEAARKAAEDKAEATRKAAEAKPPAPTTAPAKKRVAKAAPRKARVKVLVKENKDFTILNLRDQLAKQQRETMMLRASSAGFRGGIEVAKEFAVATQPRISIRNSATGGAGGSATAKAVAKNGRSSQEDATATTAPGQPGGDKPKADPKKDQPKVDPKPEAPKDGAEGKGKNAAKGKPRISAFAYSQY